MKKLLLTVAASLCIAVCFTATAGIAPMIVEIPVSDRDGTFDLEWIEGANTRYGPLTHFVIQHYLPNGQQTLHKVGPKTRYSFHRLANGTHIFRVGAEYRGQNNNGDFQDDLYWSGYSQAYSVTVGSNAPEGPFGDPVYVPIGVGGITTIIPIYENAQYVGASQATRAVLPNMTTNTLSSGKRVLPIDRPNGYGVSITRIANLSVTDRPLTLLNVGNGNVNHAASLIVLEADNFTLNNTVENLGEPADLLLISKKSNGVINCTACEFKGFNRVTLAVGETIEDINEINGIGAIETHHSGSIILNGIDAPGVVGLNILAANVQQNGIINTHKKAHRLSNGVYEANPNGRYTIATGSVSLLSGDLTWHFDKDMVLSRSTNVSDNSHFGGNITAAGAKIVATRPLAMNTHINTTADAKSTLYYRGAPVIADNRITIHSYASENLTLNRSLIAHGVNINSGNGSIVIHGGGRIESQNTDIIAKGALVNYGQIKTETLNIAASRLDNQSIIKAGGETQVYTDGAVLNRHGGSISSKTLHVEAGGVLINGSRTPFNQYPNGYLNEVNDRYHESLNSAELGIFYTAGVDHQNWSGKSQSNNTSAYIHAKRISIKAGAVENINPYYAMFEEADEELVLSRTFFDQVQFTAEERLEIESSRYIVNASALMGVTSENGKVHVKARNIVNERYRVTSILDRNTYDINPSAAPNTEIDSATETAVYDRIAVFSPSGRLFSMGSFEASATNLFLNNVGYFEVFGEAKINAGSHFYDFGLKGRRISRSSISSTYYGSYCGTGCASSHITPAVVTGAREVDSLFFVNGSAAIKVGPQFLDNVDEGEDSILNNYNQNRVQRPEERWHFTNHDPFDQFMRDRIEYLRATQFDEARDGLVSDRGNNADGQEIIWNINNERHRERMPDDFEYRSYVSEGVIDYETGQLTINWSESLLAYVERRVTECNQGYSDNCQGTEFHEEEIANGGSKVYRLFDEMGHAYESLLGWVEGIFDEIKWWEDE
ncbi:hypothetical protein [Marinibactrum halimedae]|uniref:Fibronectin type-III domain-containing protein n=1 Tax=Marinibactrum halimedae TaxID=1444977 RepID=A0AA37T0V8_9GAMM|nr:hypothetical protein [Marinibactrum halimedae]MCD9457817.1 hypothetical protein [Marinibactrum halimedae]GLS24809.1 hypothetical protein GCM10007877_05230 [Marinibactrum halimedae]